MLNRNNPNESKKRKIYGRTFKSEQSRMVFFS